MYPKQHHRLTYRFHLPAGKSEYSKNCYVSLTGCMADLRLFWQELKRCYHAKKLASPISVSPAGGPSCWFELEEQVYHASTFPTS